MNNKEKKSFDNLIIKVVKEEVEPLSQATIGIDYKYGIPILVIRADLKDQYLTGIYQYSLYTDGNKYAFVAFDKEHEKWHYFVDSDFLKFIFTVRLLVEDHITNKVFKRTNKYHEQYQILMFKLNDSYNNFWNNFINEKTINQLAINDKSLLKYTNFDNLGLGHIFNNDNRIYHAGSILLNHCKIILSYYCELIDGIIYINLMLTKNSVTVHEIVKVNHTPKGFIMDGVKPRLLKFISPLVHPYDVRTVIDKCFQIINQAILRIEEGRNFIELYSRTVGLYFSRDDNKIRIKCIGDEYQGIIIPQNLIQNNDYSKAIDFVITKFPLISKLEFYQIGEAITRGREILDDYLNDVKIFFTK